MIKVQPLFYRHDLGDMHKRACGFNCTVLTGILTCFDHYQAPCLFLLFIVLIVLGRYAVTENYTALEKVVLRKGKQTLVAWLDPKMCSCASADSTPKPTTPDRGNP